MHPILLHFGYTIYSYWLLQTFVVISQADYFSIGILSKNSVILLINEARVRRDLAFHISYFFFFKYIIHFFKIYMFILSAP